MKFPINFFSNTHIKMKETGYLIPDDTCLTCRSCKRNRKIAIIERYGITERIIIFIYLLRIIQNVIYSVLTIQYPYGRHTGFCTHTHRSIIIEIRFPVLLPDNSQAKVSCFISCYLRNKMSLRNLWQTNTISRILPV